MDSVRMLWSVLAHMEKKTRAYSICFRCGLFFDDKNTSDIHKDISKHIVSLVG